MAATRLIALHANKGKTIAQTLGDRTDYAKNPEKTEKGELVTAYGCDPITVDEEFMLQKRLYYQVTGRSIICSDIDTILAGKPKDFKAFVMPLENAGYAVKRGRHLAVKGKTLQRFIQLSSLVDGYREEDIRALFTGERKHESKTAGKMLQEKPVSLLIDVQKKLREKKETKEHQKEKQH